ncbi:MAG: glycosyltransferase family 4 protein [Candidatus Omnitrophica bacterium]|nr:glycosyltransferase family 4 protein [Candidatus Omnitrophota bacterium]
MKKFNIVHLHWGFPPIIGGVETHLTILLPAIAKMGHKVSLLTGAVEGMPVSYKYKGVNIVRTPIMDLNWLYKRGINGLEDEINKVFSRFLKGYEPDIIHAHNMHYFSLVHAQILENYAKKMKVPLILTAHNVWDDTLYLKILRGIDWTHIIAVSHYIKKEIIGVGYDDKKITVIHHGIDAQKYNPMVEYKSIYKKYPQLKNRKVIFHPARMGLAKGCDVSVKAFSIIKNKIPDAFLILAGSKNIIDWGETQQKDIAYIVDLVKFFNLGDDILIDMFKLEDMPKLYGASSVCIYPSTSGEPFGLTMLEAMASAKPMIVTNSGGMPEIIRDGINGYVVPVKDFEALASRIIQLLNDDKLRDRFGHTGREMIEQNFTTRIVTRNTLNVYNNMYCKRYPRAESEWITKDTWDVNAELKHVIK